MGMDVEYFVLLIWRFSWCTDFYFSWQEGVCLSTEPSVDISFFFSPVFFFFFFWKMKEGFP